MCIRDRSGGKDGQARDIIRYINEHLKEPLTLEGLAGTFYMSKNHLTSIFKRATGTTVARYILYKRMAVVRGELSAGIPAAEAACLLYTSRANPHTAGHGCD